MQKTSIFAGSNATIAGGASVVIGVFLFVAADVFGSSARMGYSPVSDAISELIETGAPNKFALDVLIGSYHALVVPFAYGLFAETRNGPLSFIGPSLLAFAGCLGVILTSFFPCDVGCEPVTTRGTLHIFIAVPMGFAILLAILMFSRRFARLPGWTGFARYSGLTGAIGLSLATATVIFAETEVVGVLERALTLSYLQWYLVIGANLVRIGLRGSG